MKKIVSIIFLLLYTNVFAQREFYELRTYEIKWGKNDLVMVDNKRFMHGRRAYKKNSPRDIVVIQTSKASFSYGTTFRKIA